MKGILDGSNDKVDRQLMDDVANAPDPFDGGCPADVMPRPIPPATSFANKLDTLQRESEAAGVRAAIIWLRNAGAVNTADFLEDAHAHGEVLK